jgi:hypothetical protein
MKANILEAWKYKNPEMICDGLIAETERIKRAKERKAKAHVTAKKDGFFRQSKSIHFKALVKIAKRGGHHA